MYNYSMPTETPITLDEYVSNLKSLEGMNLKDCYHTQDSMLRFILSENGKDFTLILEGDWDLFDGQKKLCSSQDSYATHHEYYEKLRGCAAEIKLKIKSLQEITYEGNEKQAIIIFDNGWKIIIQQNEFGLLDIQNNETKEYVIFSIDEGTKKPKYYKSKS